MLQRGVASAPAAWSKGHGKQKSFLYCQLALVQHLCRTQGSFLSVIKGNISIPCDISPAIQRCVHGRSRANQLPIHTMLCNTYKTSQGSLWKMRAKHRIHEQSPPVLTWRAGPMLQESSRLTKKQSADPSSHPFFPTDHISYLGGCGRSCPAASPAYEPSSLVLPLALDCWYSET